MKRSTVLSLLLLAVAVVGGALVFVNTRHQQLDRIISMAPSPAPTTAPQPTPATPPATVAKKTSPAQPLPKTLEFKRLSYDTNNDLAEACLLFSAALLPDGQYQDYLRITPDTKPALRVAGDRLCIGGLSHGQDYAVELLAGLPAAEGLKLPAGEKVDISLGSRPPTVAFAGSGIILPRDSAAGVPITTVNVDKVNIRVYRVSDRLLSQITRDQLDEKEVYLYRLEQLAGSQGALVWRGEMDVANRLNEKVTTAFPIREAVKPWLPGAYFVVAWNAADGNVDDTSSNDDYSPRYFNFRPAGQWIIDSDIGLTTYQGSDGMHVYARSLQSAGVMAGVTLTLIARNNEELARTTTDAHGHAVFAPGLFRGTGGMTPVSVMAYSGDKKDFNYMDLQRTGFDLSDRGVEGRTPPGPIDAYLYTDRGIYRPGETVNVVAMVRDRTTKALTDVPITLVLRRPDGVETRRQTLIAQAAGAVHLPIAISSTARRGIWSVQAFIDPTGNPVGRVEFSVEDFVPQKLKVALSTTATMLRPNQDVAVDVEGRFLYGAPAADLNGEGEIRIARDPDPFPKYPGFRFGLQDAKFKGATIPLEVGATDAAGKTRVTGKITDVEETSLPLKATLSVGLYEPGGRVTSDTLSLPLRLHDASVGIRPLFSDDTAPYHGEAGFEVILLDGQGQRLARKSLDYEFVREEWNYNWYRGDDGRWRWETFYRDVPRARGSQDVAAEPPATLRQAGNWGRYRHTVRDKQSGAETSVRFYAGWRDQNAASETPDTATVSTDKPSYAVGETAHIRIEAPFAGEAQLVMANDRVFESRSIKVPAEGATIDVPVSADWGSGAYALVTAYRPLAQKTEDKTPVRAIGVAWISVDQSGRKLTVSFANPDSIKPRQKIDLPIKVSGHGSMQDVVVTVAAVDEGILQLTKFTSPAPDKYYFGKRRLTVDIRDDYGRLLDGSAESVGRIRSGGDAAAGRSLEVVPVKVVSLFSGFVRVDKDGNATIPLDIPDFTGELRLMAVAFDATRVGMGEGHMKVRDPVVSDMVLPRFLAPGDQGRATILLHNVEGKPGAYTLSLNASGAVGLNQPVEQEVDLPEGKRLTLSWPILGRDIGTGTVSLHLEGPDGFSVTREWPIEVRPAQAPMTVELSGALAPDGQVAVDSEVLNQFVPGSVDASVTISRVGGIDVAGLLRSLDRYPYGCLEQTTSRAFPLLFFNDLASTAGVTRDSAIEGRVQGAIYRILDMQSAEGRFGMWSFSGRPADAWLQVFALDFLTQARAAKYVVPEAALKRGLTWLRATVDQFDADSAAYGYYVLARSGLADVGQLRYFQDTQFNKLHGPLGRGQIGAALALSGEKGRATSAFEQAFDYSISHASWVPSWNYYGSELRDIAALIVFAIQAGQQNIVPRLAAKLREEKHLGDRYTTTQEKTWVLMAAHEMMGAGGPLKLTATGRTERTFKDPAVFAVDPTAAANRFVVHNDTGTPLWSTVSVRGVPRDMLGAESKGVTIERRFFRTNGTVADLGKLQQNDRLVVLISGTSLDRNYHEMALLDLLPAGFEIESVIPYNKDGPTYDFAPTANKPSRAEARDDRFFASFSLGHKDYPRDYRRWWSYYDDEEEDAFSYGQAYVVRAVTPGTYVLPAARIEDMYRPDVYARTAVGSVTIAPRN